LVHAGIEDVLISNEVVGVAKLERLAALAKLAKVSICVDDQKHVDDLRQVTERFAVQVEVLVEIDVGAGRCGVSTPEQAVDLAKRISESSTLRFKGLQAYQGGAQHIREHHRRRSAIEEAVKTVSQVRDRLRKETLECDVITGAGTGTYRFEAASGVYTELQCGSYIFMDADYGRNRNESGGDFHEFENSLFVFTSVMSKSRPGAAVVDAGLKAVSVDSGLPLIHGIDQVNYTGVSDEHGTLDTTRADDALELGDKLKLIPGHCDPTVNLYDWFIGIRNGRVEAIWPVVARGAVL